VSEITTKPAIGSMQTGCQYRRISSPIGLLGSTQVSS
jgi:hypothetical protein